MASESSIAPTGTPTAQASGISFGAHKSSALSQPHGEQVAHFLGLVATDLGNPVVDLYRNGALAYKDTSPSSLTISGGTLVLPIVLDEPPEVNGSASDSGDWTCVLTNPVNNASITVPGALSRSLDGSNRVEFVVTIYPPGGLDSNLALSVSGANFVNPQGQTVKLSGGNMYAGPMAYDVAEFYETNTAFDQISKFNASTVMLDRIASDHPNFNALRLTLSPLIFAKTGGVFDYPAQSQLLLNLIQEAGSRGWYVLVSPYGMGWYSDFESRARKNQTGANPSLPNDDPSQPAEDGTQDEYNNAAIRTEVKAMYSEMVPFLLGCENVIICGLNEWRQVSDATWEASERDIRNHIRSLGYNGLYIADGPQWATDVPYTQAASLVADDPAGNMAFSIHGYIDSGTPGTSNEAVSKLKKANVQQCIDNGIPVIIGEYGNQIQLSNLNNPQTITEQEILDWQTAYVGNHLDCAGLLSWQVAPWDQHSEYGTRLDGWFNVATGNEPLVLNATGTHRVGLQRQFVAGVMDGEFPDQTALQAAAEAAMVNTTPGTFKDDRVLHGVNATFGANWPEQTKVPPAYTERYWPGPSYPPNYSDPQLFPFTHCWERQTGAWGSAHTNNPAHDRVAMHLRDWFLAVFYVGTGWTVAYTNKDWVLSAGNTIYSGDFATFSTPVPIYTLPDGREGTTVFNASGITTPQQVKFIHSWPTGGDAKYTIPAGQVNDVLCICTGHLSKLSLVNGGTAADISNSGLMAFNGTDIYTASGNDPFTRPGTMIGRPRFLTADWQWIVSHAHRDGQAASNQFLIDNPLPVIA